MQQTSPLRSPSIDVISIQSQVVYGSVGNGIAYRALLKKGLEALQVPSVLFGCPPYYGKPHGGVISGEWFGGFLDDLIARGVMKRARAVIVGYLGDVMQCHILANWLQRVRALNPQIKIYIDPVMGDYGEGIYVDKRIVNCYRSPFLRLANGLTPNGFELEQLCGRQLSSQEQTQHAAQALLNDTTEWVLVTSAPGVAQHEDEVGLMLVTRQETRCFTHPKVKSAVKGTGDLFAALLVSHLLHGAALDAAVVAAGGEVCNVLAEAAHFGWEEIGSLRALQP
ncbi:TPA: pyridoxal kinase [Serratia marcescens]|uniref:pyridoxal kinase n=1 Tax=Serratia TaxID=613 RepID=UPI001A33129C|nr:pyridoxal kinase [Serratia marcescens]MDP8620653.1 pyridoxal kinase [Serratia marcescens]HAT2905098.1 pyridoxal kinase [Serratia marcescens]HAT2909782.1 pyridoxal kinase [Serratia marcescens]